MSAPESVWDYPRPPAVLPCLRRVRVVLAGELLADSRCALRVLETSHPPTIYVPPEDVRLELLAHSLLRPTVCEFKGVARYMDAVIGTRRFAAVAWTYPNPARGYEQLRGCLSFYPGRVDEAWLDEERVRAQEGDFYGGWITSEVRGPFKGAPGTAGW